MSSFISTNISIIISAIALLISILVYIERVRARKRAEHERMLQRSRDLCDQAYELVSFNTQHMGQATASFNKLVAVQTILEKNLLELDPSRLEELIEDFKSLQDDYESVSGQKLGFHAKDLDITAEIYDIHDFPPRLDAFYEMLHSETIARRSTLENDDLKKQFRLFKRAR